MKTILKILITALFFYACGTTRKSMEKMSRAVNTSDRYKSDSTVKQQFDHTSVSTGKISSNRNVDSMYSRIIEEEITEWVPLKNDSFIPYPVLTNRHAENSSPGVKVLRTKRLIREQGQLAVKEDIVRHSTDSTGTISEHSLSVHVANEKDSVSETVQSKYRKQKFGLSSLSWILIFIIIIGTIIGVLYKYRRHILLRLFGIKK